MRRFATVVKVGCVAALAVTMQSADAQEVEASAEPDVCLRNNRIWSWDLVDESTIRIRARGEERDYLVLMQGPCTGLQTVFFSLRFQTATNLGCVGPGDRIHYEASGMGRQVCFVREVTLAPAEEEN